MKFLRSSSSPPYLLLSLSTLFLKTTTECVLGGQIVSNPKGSPSEHLGDEVCNSAQGRTEERCEVELDVPSSCAKSDGTSDCPIVFFFHGAGGNNRGFKSNSGVHENDVIGVYPQGEDGWNTGPKSSNDCPWNEYDCTKDPDEGAFVASIISTLRDMGANGNVYAIGSSNGGALANRLGSNAGNELPIRGFVSLVTQLLQSPSRSGPGVLNYNQPLSSSLSNNHPVSVLNIMGTGDGLIPYGGGSSPVFGGNEEFQLYSALDSMLVWSDYNGCDTANPIIADVRTSTNTGGDGTGVYYQYPNCNDGAIVEHYAVVGAGHNAGQTSIKDTDVSFDLAHDFIRRCEGGTTPTQPQPRPPATTPTPPSPVADPGPCADDSDWHGKFNEMHNCDYVAENPNQRCGWENTDGILAKAACKIACNTCDDNDDEQPPNPSPPPTPSSCEDDASWHGKHSNRHGCGWVSQNADRLCGLVVSAEGVVAANACPVTCDMCYYDDHGA